MNALLKAAINAALNELESRVDKAVTKDTAHLIAVILEAVLPHANTKFSAPDEAPPKE